MGAQRIRWPNVAKLAGAVGLGAAVLFALPALLSSPEPPPLEPDIGLRPSAPPVPEPGAVLPASPATESPGDNRAGDRSPGRTEVPDRPKPNRGRAEKETPDPLPAQPSPPPDPGPSLPIPPAPSPVATQAPELDPTPPLIREFGL